MGAKVLPFPGEECALRDAIYALDAIGSKRSTADVVNEVFLSTEDAQAYEEYFRRFVEDFCPHGESETRLVKNLAYTQWQLDRIPGLEFGLLALGRRKYDGLFLQETSPKSRAALLDAHVLVMEAQRFEKLHQQEDRLRRQHSRYMRKLQTLQAKRQGEG